MFCARRLLLCSVTTALAVSGAGCGAAEDAAPGSASTPIANTPTGDAASPATGIDTLPGAGTEPVTKAATNRRTALLTAVRAARHEGFDRIVFQFRTALSGYDVRYVRRPVRQDGSGKVVPLRGRYALQVRMENALDADLARSGAPLTYTGPQRFVPGTPEIAELARSGGFEGILTWVAGLRDRVGFRVTTLRAPARLVVNVRNH